MISLGANTFAPVTPVGVVGTYDDQHAPQRDIPGIASAFLRREWIGKA
jgi:hypothetical protein